MRRLLNRFAAALVCVFTATAVGAAAGDERPASRTITLPIFSERVSFSVPKAWRLVGESAGQRTYSASFLAPGETPAKWTSRITIYGFAKTDELRNTDAVLGEVTEQYHNRCRQPLQSGKSDSYKLGSEPAVILAIRCGEDQSGLPERGYFLVLQGKPGLYVLMYAEHGAPLHEGDAFTAAQFVDFVSPVKLCDADVKKGRCAVLALEK